MFTKDFGFILTVEISLTPFPFPITNTQKLEKAMWGCLCFSSFVTIDIYIKREIYRYITCLLLICLSGKRKLFSLAKMFHLHRIVDSVHCLDHGISAVERKR